MDTKNIKPEKILVVSRNLPLIKDTFKAVHYYSGEGNGSPLQYSCLENPRDGGAWWAAVYGVAQSWTRLSDLAAAAAAAH